jgi:hypothetical protein
LLISNSILASQLPELLCCNHRQRGCWVMDGVSIHPASCIYCACRCMFQLDCTIQENARTRGWSLCEKNMRTKSFYIIRKNKYFSLDPRLRSFSFSSHPQPTSVYANAAFLGQKTPIHMYFSQHSNLLKESIKTTPTQVRGEIRLEYFDNTCWQWLAVSTTATSGRVSKMIRC